MRLTVGSTKPGFSIVSAPLAMSTWNLILSSGAFSSGSSVPFSYTQS
jgi:hypothetical protein